MPSGRRPELRAGRDDKDPGVDIKDHGIYDDDKTLEIALKNPKNAVLGKTAVHTIRLSSAESPSDNGCLPRDPKGK